MVKAQCLALLFTVTLAYVCITVPESTLCQTAEQPNKPKFSYRYTVVLKMYNFYFCENVPMIPQFCFHKSKFCRTLLIMAILVQE